MGTPRAPRFPRRRAGARVDAGVLLALYGLLLVVPSANYHVFDGLPASRLPEFLGLALLAPFLVSRGLRRLYGRLVGTASPAVQWGLLALGVVTLLAKLVLLTSATHAGFLACYRSPLAAPPAGACERSYENPFSRFGVTRIDRVLDFAPRTWNLSFVNSLRFNFDNWVPGNVRRDRLPLAATWTAIVERPRPWTAEIGYVGVVALQVDSMEPTRLAARYDARAVAHVPVPAGRHRLTVDYAFDDASRVGDRRVLGPYATLRLARVHEATGRSPLVRSLRPAGAWRWTGTAVDVVAILFAATLAVTCALVVNRDAWVPAVVAAAAASHLWVGHRACCSCDWRPLRRSSGWSTKECRSIRPGSPCPCSCRCSSCRPRRGRGGWALPCSASRIGQALYAGGDRAVLIAVRGLLLAWVVAVGAWALTGRAGLPLALLVSLPICYLAPHLLYAEVYYPRHFVAGYFATGAVVLLTAAWWDRGGRRGGSGEGKGPAARSPAEGMASR